jgi:DNA-binding XRE family transcriptional regulator
MTHERDLLDATTDEAHEIYKNYGHAIKHVRSHVRGYTQRELADLAGVTPSYISQVECGRRIPSLILAMRLSLALNTTQERLLARALIFTEEP